MKLHDYYTYSWFSNLSYVLWDNGNIGTESSSFSRVDAANRALRAPTDLATKIFALDQWYIPTLGGFESNDAFGFAANLFVNSKTNEKVLAIRGTETDGLFGVFGAQTIADFRGMAVTAEVKMGQRRVIEFLLSPLLRYKQESGRER